MIDENELRGRWHRIEVNVKWSKNGDGFFRVWVNGEKKVDYSGQTMTKSKTYFKYGVYRSFISRYRDLKGNGIEDALAQTVYYANVKRAKCREWLSVSSN